jgi:ATPase subunit of ABC transporter with duplicated ATPase domains
MLSVNDVTQIYGGKALFENVTVTFPPGRRFGLTGPNGAGKSTFMKFLAGDAEPQKGSVSRPKKTSRSAGEKWQTEKMVARCFCGSGVD